MEGFSGYPTREIDPRLALSVLMDVETYDYPSESGYMMVSRPVRHRIIVEGTVERVAPYLRAVEHALSLENE